MSADQQLARTMRHAMQLYLAARQAGVSREDAEKGVFEELRGAWPKKPTKFPPQCPTCDDTGWEERACTAQMRCGRKWCHDSHPAHEHLYVEPCHCAQGECHRKRIATVEDEIARATRVAKKKHGFTRMGQ